MNRSTSLMLFNKNNILRYIPNVNAVFYLRGIADENSLYPIYYIGQGSRNNIKRKLIDLLEKKNWTDIVYINYVECDREKLARSLEKYEINRHRPKYNFSPNVENIMHISMYQTQR